MYRKYANGNLKPFCRGLFHFIFLLYIPLLFIISVLSCNTLLKFTVLIIYFLFLTLLLIISSLYHIFSWELKVEIILRKIDYSLIFINATTNLLEIYIFILKDYYFLLLSFSFSLLGCICTFKFFDKNKFIVHFLLVLILFLLQLYNSTYFLEHLTKYEIYSYVLALTCNIFGYICFLTEKPKLKPDFFGFHEIFHLFTILGFSLIFYMNYSILERI